jgi:hypothetical protein
MAFFTRTKTKNWLAKKRPCILCYNMGAASVAYGWVTVRFIPMRRVAEDAPIGPKGFDGMGWPKPVYELQDKVVEKEVGLCWKHCQANTEKNTTGVLDREAGGEWIKTPWGAYIPVRDGHYCLIGGPDNCKIVIGPSGCVPKWM